MSYSVFDVPFTAHVFVWLPYILWALPVTVSSGGPNMLNHFGYLLAIVVLVLDCIVSTKYHLFGVIIGNDRADNCPILY